MRAPTARPAQHSVHFPGRAGRHVLGAVRIREPQPNRAAFAGVGAARRPGTGKVQAAGLAIRSAGTWRVPANPDTARLSALGSLICAAHVHGAPDEPARDIRWPPNRAIRCTARLRREKTGATIARRDAARTGRCAVAVQRTLHRALAVNEGHLVSSGRPCRSPAFSFPRGSTGPSGGRATRRPATPALSGPRTAAPYRALGGRTTREPAAHMHAILPGIVQISRWL